MGSCVFAAFDEDEGLIVEVDLSDSTLLAEGMVIYPDKKNEWFIPLGEFAQALGLAIDIDPGGASASGFIIEEGRPFQLDLKSGDATYDGETRQIESGGAVAQGEEIYVRAKLLGKWLPINLNLSTYRAQIVVTPREKLPIQSKREREAEMANSRGDGSITDPGYPRLRVPHSVLQAPFIDHQQSFNFNVAGEQASKTFSHNTQLSGELFEAEAQASLFGDERKIESGRLRLARTEPEGLGALDLKQVQFFDTVLPSLPLITGGKEAKGFLASSFPLNVPTSFDQTILEGPLPDGWEVILYRNDVLLQRSTGDGKGRYLFREIRLQYGINNLRLAFFGPRGERREEIRTYNITPDLIKPGAAYYTLGVGILENTNQRIQGQFAKNLFRFFTLNTGFLVDREPNQYYAYAGLTGVNSLFLFQTTCAANQAGGKACEWGQQFAVGPVALSTKYTKLFDFSSDIFNSSSTTGAKQDSEIAAILSHPIPLSPPVNMQWEAVKKNFIGTDKSDILLRNQLTFGGGPLNWSNRLEYDFNSTTRLGGVWEVSYLPSTVRLTLSSAYTDQRVSSVSLGSQYLTPWNLSVASLLSYEFLSSRPTFQAGATRLFKSFSIGASATYSTPRDYGAGLNFSISLVPDTYGGRLEVSSQPVTRTGAASILVYQDKDRNGNPDPKEPGLEGIQLYVNGRELEMKSNSEGRVFVPNLEAFAPVDASISMQALKDPNLRPGQSGVRFHPRPGKLASVALPLIVVGEIDGLVLQTSKEKTSGTPLRRVRMELLDRDGNILYRVKTDSDGIYLFEGIPAGEYVMRVAPAYLKSKGFTPIPKQHNISIARTGSFESGKDFRLIPR